jgi:hypothetical protein
MSWLDENKDRGSHPPKDEEPSLLDFLRSQYGEQDYSRIMGADEKAWDTKRIMEAAKIAWEPAQKIMGRNLLAGIEISPHMFLPEVEHFALPNGQPAVRFNPPKRYTFGIDFAAPVFDPTKAFTSGIESLLHGEDPEIRIKVRKHKLKFNFNN